jgi:hypothetical protein
MVLSKMVSLTTSMVAKWAAGQVAELTQTSVSQAAQAASVVTSQTAQTSAVVAGTAVRTATTASAAVASHAASAAVGGPTVIADAAKAFSGTYASVAQIPYVGWILAPIAASAAFVAVAAYESMASFEGGTDYVPRDMPAFIHQGEAVLNTSDAASYRSGDSNTASVSLHYAPTFSGATPAGIPAQAPAEADNFKSYVWNLTRNGSLRLPGR